MHKEAYGFNKSASNLETFDYFCTSWKKFLNICFPAPKAWTSELRSQCSLPKSVDSFFLEVCYQRQKDGEIQNVHKFFLKTENNPFLKYF